MPAFYHQPQSVAEIVEDSVDRLLALAGSPAADARQWAGTRGDANRGEGKK
jgi:flavin prenyltransferase